MRHTGKSFAWEDGTDRITDSTVNDTRISINWWDGEKTGHMELHSADGISYQGRFGYPILDSHRLVKFTRFNSVDGQVVLLGHWRNTASKNQENWMIRLWPAGEDE